MNINGIETFLIGMILSGAILALFFYLRKLALKFPATSFSPQFRQSAPTVEGKPLNSTNRRRIESKPTVICSLPIHQIVRPEAALW